MKRFLVILVSALLLSGCAGTILPPPSSPTAQQVPLEQLTPKQILTVGWQAYNKIWEDYNRMLDLKDPSLAEAKVMNWEYDLLNEAWPVLKKATEGFEEGQPLEASVIDIIRELTRNVRF